MPGHPLPRSGTDVGGSVAQFGRGRRLRSGVLQVRILPGPLELLVACLLVARCLVLSCRSDPQAARNTQHATCNFNRCGSSIGLRARPSEGRGWRFDPSPQHVSKTNTWGPSSNGRTSGLHPDDEGSSPSGVHLAEASRSRWSCAMSSSEGNSYSSSSTNGGLA